MSSSGDEGEHGQEIDHPQSFRPCVVLYAIFLTLAEVQQPASERWYSRLV
jgi:hypothetical protein